MTQNTAAELRKRLKEARQHLAVADRQRGSLLIRARLYTWLAILRDQKKDQGVDQPQIIACYWPLPDEPDITPLTTQWDEAGLTVALPRMVAQDQPLEFHPWHSDMVLSAGAFGVMEPPASTPLMPDVVLIPTLGFTPEGDRLGYGKGFYDRTLAHLSNKGCHSITIGVAWDVGAISAMDPSYSPQPHDFRLDAIITPTSWYPAPPSDGSARLGLQASPDGHGG